MDHGDVYTGAVEYQLQRFVDDAQGHQCAVDQTTRLQQHNPGGNPHQNRGPERQQYQDHQQVALPGWQVGQQIGQRISQHQADGGDDKAHPQGTGEDVQVNGLVRGGLGQLAEIIDAVVQSRQQVERGDATGVTANSLPVGRIAPALVQLLQCFFIRSRLGLERQGSGGFRQQAAIAGQLHVQTLGGVAEGLVLARLAKVFAQCLVHRLVRQALTVPLRDRRNGLRQACDNFRVTDALVEQRGNRHQENQQQE
ncbi:hypothetical protein D3C76_977820 [compost metagenome]